MLVNKQPTDALIFVVLDHIALSFFPSLRPLLLTGGGTPRRRWKVRADALHHLPHLDRAREHPSHHLHLRAEARVEGRLLLPAKAVGWQVATCFVGTSLMHGTIGTSLMMDDAIVKACVTCKFC